jgi:hypothetical protein
MSRSIALFLAGIFVAAPAAAANYSATLTQPTTARVITRDISWTCGPAACQGATEQSRPVVLCEALAKRAGTVESFLVDGRALSATELERCNASARTQPSTALAKK